jgi:hypothetical protein
MLINIGEERKIILESISDRKYLKLSFNNEEFDPGSG